MSASLVPCPSCSRHVRVAEARCPFCASALPNTLAQRVIPNSTQRLSRAAAFAFTASLTIAGCSSTPAPGTDAAVSTDNPSPTDNPTSTDRPSATDTPTPTDTPSATDAGLTDRGTPQDDGGAMALYGGPPVDVVLPNDVQDGGGIMPLYGAPVDAGMEQDVPSTIDDGGGIAPLYGAPADAGGGGLRYGAPPPPDAF